MDSYLFKEFKGRFRVLADINFATNDFPRDEDGLIDSSFDDYYIPCANKSKIRHYEDDILFYYCPSLGRFSNMIKQIYEDKVGDIDKFKTTYKETVKFDKDRMYEELIEKGILINIDEMDNEGEFYFKTDMIDYISELVKPRTAGASINPFSIKNLPIKKYDIPEEDLEKYNEIVKDFDRAKILKLAKITRDFDKIIQKEKGKKFDIEYEKKALCLRGKEFIHSIGMFDKFLQFIANKVN